MSYSGWINEDTSWNLNLKVVLLILDNHGSHTSYEAIRFCKEHDIELIGLPPRSTHMVQPLDRIFCQGTIPQECHGMDAQKSNRSYQ
jgi:hypothetical protein